MEELLNKALLVQKQTKKYCFENAAVIAISDKFSESVLI